MLLGDLYVSLPVRRRYYELAVRAAPRNREAHAELGCVLGMMMKCDEAATHILYALNGSSSAIEEDTLYFLFGVSRRCGLTNIETKILSVAKRRYPHSRFFMRRQLERATVLFQPPKRRGRDRTQKRERVE